MLERRRRKVVLPKGDPVGVAIMACGRCDRREERVSYASVPLTLGCGHIGRARIAGYDWDRDLEEDDHGR